MSTSFAERYDAECREDERIEQEELHRFTMELRRMCRGLKPVMGPLPNFQRDSRLCVINC